MIIILFCGVRSCYSHPNRQVLREGVREWLTGSAPLWRVLAFLRPPILCCIIRHCDPYIYCSIVGDANRRIKYNDIKKWQSNDDFRISSEISIIMYFIYYDILILPYYYCYVNFSRKVLLQFNCAIYTYILLHHYACDDF